MRTERSFDLPSVLHEHDLTDGLLKEFGAFVGTVTKQKYIFLSPTEQLVFEDEDFFAAQLPRDVDLIYIKIEGTTGFVEIKHRSRFKNLGEVADRTLNQVTIQGQNPVTVRGLHDRVEHILKPQRFLFRILLYRYPLISAWASLVLVWFGEYRVARLVNPRLSMASPLTSFGAIELLSIAFGTLLIYLNIALRAFTFWFPYFEIDGNLSRHRLGTQKIVAAVWTSLLASGVWNLVSLFNKTAGH